jgi:OOP family OmpA-OmpF porin
VAEPVRTPDLPTDAAPPAPSDGAARVPDAALRELPAPPDRPARDAPRPTRWQELRTLLLGPEHERLTRVERKLDDPHLHVDDVSQVLPAAIERRAGDRELGDALGPVVSEAIKVSVRRDPQPLVDAIFPVIGPAIRRSIASAFSELVQSINTTVEHSFTPQGLAWRFEAMRTGRSFGEVVLSHSLVYRVEQLFLVHHETGLLIAHHSAPGVKSLSPEMMAAMLTAIGDFAHDTLEHSREDGVDAVNWGALTLMSEKGPRIVLSAVIRGQPPMGYRDVLQRAVEGVHRVHSQDIERFALTGATFPVRPDLLEPCLVAQLQEPSRAKGWWRAFALAVLVLAGVGWCAGPRYLEQRRFNRYVDELRREPGIVVGSTARTGGRHVITGLRDPLAADPQQQLARVGLDSTRVESHWEPYVALRPEFVLRRAGTALAPPSGVQLGMRGDTLTATGVASGQWTATARRVALALGGVSAVDFSALQDSAETALRSAADRLAQVEVTFARGDAFPAPGYRPIVDSLALGLGSLLSAAAAAGRELVVEARGATDSVGTAEGNAALRVERARTLRALLLARGIPAASVTIHPDSSISGRRASLRIAVRPPRTLP